MLNNVTPIQSSPKLFSKDLRDQMEGNLKNHGGNPKLIVNVVEQTICAFALAIVGSAAAVLGEKLANKLFKK